MANRLYQEMSNQQNPFGSFKNLQNLKQQVNQLKQAGYSMQQVAQQLSQSGLSSDQIIQHMLNSGQISQEQYNDAFQRTQQLQQMMGHQNGSN